MNREDFRTGFGQTTCTEEDQGMGQDYRGRSRYNSNYRGSFGYNMRGNQRYVRQNNNNRRETLEIKITIGIGVGHMKDRIETEWMIEVIVDSNSRSRSGSRAVTNRDRIRCFECREYDHFARDCLATQANR